MRSVNYKPFLSLIIVVILSIAVTLLAVSHAGGVQATQQDNLEPPPNFFTSANEDNLLINGNMDELPFYPRPVNHYVAGMWYEWFVTSAYRIPEFIDGGTPYHQVCYPRPADGDCTKANNHSQGYILWSDLHFTAGIYQSVPVTPCQMYAFQAYARNDASSYQSKVGISSIGAMMPPYVPPDGDGLPKNCPPDGTTVCPNPGVSSPEALPSSIEWSEYISPQAFTWMSQTVATEALSTTITVWTYTESDGNRSQSAYWDAATLTRTTYPDNRLPGPTAWTVTDFITNVNVIQTSNAISISWETLEPSYGQVWYEHIEPHPVATPGTGTYMQYMPLIMRDYRPYPEVTLPDTTLRTTHTASITGLSSGDSVNFAIVARHFTSNTCKTEVHGPLYVQIP